jgi:hypothetical protein
MPDEQASNKGPSISIPEAIRLKHELGKSITWGNSNLNALEVEQLSRLDANDYAQIRKEYADWQKHLNVFNIYAALALLLGSLVALYLVTGWLRIVFEVIAALSGYVIIKREGHADGYVSGYEVGFEAGIHKTLGIKNEEIPDMTKMATDMEIDEMLVKKMDERKASGDQKE